MKTDVEKIFQKYGRIAGISMHKVIMIQHDVTLAQGDLFMIRHDMAYYVYSIRNQDLSPYGTIAGVEFRESLKML